LIGDYACLLVDPATGEVLSLQVEDVLTKAIDEYPSIPGALSIAELRGVAPTEAALLRRQRKSDATHDCEPLAAATTGRQRRNQEVIDAFLRDPALFGASLGDG
jgi:hypothetical protein